MRSLFLRNRRALIILHHAALIIATNYLAFWLRFDGDIPRDYLALFQLVLPLLLALRLAVFVPFRLYQGLWRYAGMSEVRNIFSGVFTSSLLFYGLVHLGLGMTHYPRAVLIVDPLLLFLSIGASRIAIRLQRDLFAPRRDKRVLVYGAGDAGEMVVRDIRSNPLFEHEPIGYVDDDTAKTGMRIHGVPVLGTGELLGEIVRRYEPDEILVAMPSADSAAIRRILSLLESFKLPIKTLPNLREILSGRAKLADIRDLSVEDLLPRAPVGLDLGPVGDLIEGSRVLVTGAAGSIGSELCRQIARLGPERLVLLDSAESPLYNIDAELGRIAPSCPREIALTNVCLSKRVFQIHRPQIVFHAAAYKHVPMLEGHPAQAVFNNVIGTCRVAEFAAGAGAKRFVLISTDKAANPLGIMGATKRIAELWIHALTQAEVSSTIFSAVRFGNVLGSNGSVVPLFLNQIRAGGPVTVTHPEVTRYFMTIPEAVQLVLIAAALARGGETFVLQMGEQIKIDDLARHLIRLAGFVPETEIAIRYTGLRQGEKLAEELVAEGELLEPSGQDKISVVRSHNVPGLRVLAAQIDGLEALAVLGDNAGVRALVHEIALGTPVRATGIPELEQVVTRMIDPPRSRDVAVR